MRGTLVRILIGLALAWSGILVRLHALPPTIAITQIQSDGTGVDVRWQTSNLDLRSTLESSDLPSGSTWSPVPGGDWPSSTNVFRDSRPLPPSRFYRVRGEPGPVDRGRLLSFTEVASMTRAQLQFFFTLAGFPVTPERDVRFIRLTYETVDAHGLRTIASGALALPMGADMPLPLLSYQHGTVLERENVPSRLNLEGFLGVAFATSGYAAVLPDYLGLGDSPGPHPFLHAVSEATAVIDLLRATRTFCALDGIQLAPKLFLAGYSQGGHATLAALREMESRHADEFTVTACAAGAGSYDLSGTTANELLSGRPQPNPYSFAYQLAAFRHVYGLPWFLAEPYATTIPALMDGTHDEDEVNAAMPADPTFALAPGVREALINDQDHPLRVALRQNDLLNWTPKARLRLYHCSGDRDVVPANSVVAWEAFLSRGAAVELLDPAPAAGHGGCAEPTLLQVKDWFDVLRN